MKIVDIFLKNNSFKSELVFLLNKLNFVNIKLFVNDKHVYVEDIMEYLDTYKKNDLFLKSDDNEIIVREFEEKIRIQLRIDFDTEELLSVLDNLFNNYKISYISIDNDEFYRENKEMFHLDGIDENKDYLNTVFVVIDKEGNSFKVIGDEIKQYDIGKSEVALLDKEYLSGHYHFDELGLMFSASWVMYFSKDYEMFLDFKKLENYEDCYDNTKLEHDGHRIRLFKSDDDYKSNEYLLWKFRDTMFIDQIAHTMLQIEYPVLPFEQLEKKINGLQKFGRLFRRTLVNSTFELTGNDEMTNAIEYKIKLSKYRSKQYQKIVKELVKLKNKYDKTKDEKVHGQLITKFYALEAVDMIIDDLEIELDFSLDSLIVIEQMIEYLEDNVIDFRDEKDIEKMDFVCKALGSYLAYLLVNETKLQYSPFNDENPIAQVEYKDNEYDLVGLIFYLINEAKDEDLYDLFSEIVENN